MSSSFSQVGGHTDSIHPNEDGSLLIKPCLPLEYEFYSMMEQARAMDTMRASEALRGDATTMTTTTTTLDEHTIRALGNLKRLSRFVPQFYGTLTEGSIDVDSLNANANNEGPHLNLSDEEIPPKQLLVLSNLLHPFHKPNILDLKLGTVLYDALDSSCTEDKKARMLQTARETTSGECGVRLTGFQVHPQPSVSISDATSLAPVITTKAYGKSLQKEQLPEGIRRVFPVLGESISLSVPPTLSGSTSTSGSVTPIFGGLPIAPTSSSFLDIPSSAFDVPKTPPLPRTDLGLPSSTLLPILHAIHTSVKHLHTIMKEIEIRMVGGSLLVVWEGDQERAQEGVEWMREKERMIRERMERGSGDEDDEEYYSEDDEEDQDTTSEEEEDQDEAFDDTSYPDPSEASKKNSNSNGSRQQFSKPSQPSREKPKRKPSAPYTISLIDFAHTRFVPGQGLDVGVLLGLDTFAGLLEGRIQEVEELESSG
ncbi:hypothetical protein C8R42DRAFT_720538 [Lentinula raphanica]|nr:hypothetical protein C8R42DRAFT_720538 [Lentinula raphanica]